MAKPKGRKKDWLGDDREQALDFIRAKPAFPKSPLEEHEIEMIADQLALEDKDVRADNPDAVLGHAGNLIRYMQSVSTLKPILSASHKMTAAEKKKLLSHFAEKEGLSPVEAEAEFVKAVTRRNPTLRSLRDAFHWVHKAQSALMAGREWREKIQTSNEETRRGALGLMEREFSRAISLAMYAGFEIGTLKARARHAEIHPGGKDRDKLFEYTFEAWKKYVAKEKAEPTAHELLAGLELASSGKAFWKSKEELVCWEDASGQMQKTQEATFRKSNLPEWKKIFRVQSQP